MELIGRKLAAAVLAAGMLGGCVPDAAMVNGKVEEPAPQPKLFEGAYAARADGKYTLPAIPTDRVPVQYQRQTVAYTSNEAPGTIVINPRERVLYFVTGKGYGDPLRDRGRQGRFPVVRHGRGGKPPPLADLDAAARDDRPQARTGRNGRRASPAGPRTRSVRARSISRPTGAITATASTGRRNGTRSGIMPRRAASA